VSFSATEVRFNFRGAYADGAAAIRLRSVKRMLDGYTDNSHEEGANIPILN
jgi:hypothetical protein